MRAHTRYDAKAQQVLTKVFEAQRDQVLAALNAKAAASWWDDKKWNRQLTTALFALAQLVANEIGATTAASLGFERGDYDPDRTLSYLYAVSTSRAVNINATTKAQISAALSAGAAVEDVFTVAIDARAPSAAVSIVTATSGFGTTEAARQLAAGKASKTWNTGPKPRAAHAAMDGETVGIDEKFSNGLAWPGDGGDADEVAGCNCGVEVSAS